MRDSNSCPWGFPGSASVKNPPANAWDLEDEGLIPGLGRSPGGRHGNPLQAGESHEQRSLTSYSPWGSKESDMTEVTEHACGHALALKKCINGETMKLPTCCHCWRWLGLGTLARGPPWAGVSLPPAPLLSPGNAEGKSVNCFLCLGPHSFLSVTMLHPVSLTSYLRNTSLQLPPPSCLSGKGLRSAVEEEMPALRSQAFRERCQDKPNCLGVTQVTFLSSGWMRRLHWNR